METLENKQNNLNSFYLNNSNLSILEIDTEGNILDLNDNFKNKIKNNTNILDLITLTHKQNFKKNLSLCIEKKQYTFKTNFSFNPIDVEDLPETANVYMEYLKKSNTILIYIEFLPPLNHLEALEYFSLMTQYAIISRKHEKTKVELEKLTLNLHEKVDEEVKKNLEKERILLQQSKMATMGEMLANITHQWKQPLSILTMANSSLKLSFENPEIFGKDNIPMALDDMENTIKNLNQTIDDFKNFFNPKKEKKKFTLLEVIEDTLKIISKQLKNSNIELIQDIEDTELYGYKNELQQVFINILKNAKDEFDKFENETNKFLFITITKQNSDLIIYIKDSAGGIPPEIKDDIFEPYFTTKKDDKGTGIGLYMSKQIIESSMKGLITVSNEKYTYENKPYEGAQFKISIPVDLRTT